MSVECTGRNVEVTPKLEELARRRTQRLERHLGGPARVRIVLSQEKKRFGAEIIASHRHRHWKAQEQTEGDPRAAVTLAFEKIDEQAKRDLQKLRDKKHGDHEDDLAQVKSVILATRDLRADSGRLSAELVAKAFGLSLREIARLIGGTPQAIWKTSDSPSLQQALRPFELVARLRSRLEEKDFARWLNMPSEHLEGMSPLDAIRDGRVEAIANWVENLLVANPI